MDLHVYNTLILSDLHLGAETSHAREATRVLKENRFQRLILLGDIFADLNFARLLKPKGTKRSRFYVASEDFYNRVIQFYGRTLKFVLQHQTITLLITAGTLVLTLFLSVVVPKGFFPVQDTGIILGISDAPESI